MSSVSTQIVGAIEPQINPETGTGASAEVAETAIVESGLFKIKTEYVIIGDEPDAAPGVFDLKSVLEPSDVAALKQYFSMMPRSILYNFFMQKIWPGIPWDMYFSGDQLAPTDRPTVTSSVYGESHKKKSYEDLVWAAVIELFNEANLEYVNANQLMPWDWEQQKTDAYYVSSSQDALKALESDLKTYQDVTLALDPKAKEIMEAYTQLPKLGDLGLEINRQNAIKELLKMKDYDSAQAIVDAYRYAGETILGETLSKPIPMDIVAADKGTVIKATPT